MENFITTAIDSIKNIDKEKVKRGLNIATTIVIIILIIALTKSCQKQQELKYTVNTVIALNDSLKLVKKTDTTVIYSKDVITLPPKVIIKEGIPIKDPETKALIEQLARERDLAAAVQVKISKQDSIIAVMKSKHPNNADYYATYNWTDTTSKHLKYNALISVDSNVTLNMNYKYHLSMTTVLKNGKKGTTATYTFDDPDIILNSANSVYIPRPPLTKGQKALNVLVPTLSGLAGGAIGYTIGHYVVPPRK